MSNKLTELIANIKTQVQAFTSAVTPAPAAPAPVTKMAATDYTLADGTVLSISALEVGGTVMIGDVAAPDGEYTLPDGNIVQVANGTIAELSSPKEDLIPEEMKCLPSKMAAMEAKIAFLEAKLSASFESQAKANETIIQALEFVSNESKEKPIDTPSKSFEEMTPLERYRFSKQFEVRRDV